MLDQVWLATSVMEMRSITQSGNLSPANFLTRSCTCSSEKSFKIDLVGDVEWRQSASASNVKSAKSVEPAITNLCGTKSFKP